MFTGLIAELGTVAAISKGETSAVFTINAPSLISEIKLGDSVAVNGVCLTATNISGNTFTADVMVQTLSLTSLSQIIINSPVNLELAVQLNARMGGHMVQGHVDGTGEFLALEALGNDNWWLRIRVPPALDRYLIEKGSVAVDGISLTVARIIDCELSITIIPHTFDHTTLGAYLPGARVNIECDMLAKHVEKLLAHRQG